MTYADAFNLRTGTVKFNDVADAIDGILSRGLGNVTTGSATAYAAAPTPAWAAYDVCRPLWVVPHVTNTGAATINVSGLGVKNLSFMKKALVGGELVQNVPCLLVWDGGTVEVQTHGGGTATWTPTWTPTGSMTYGSFVKNVGLYRRYGELVWFSAAADGTTGGSASSRIDLTLPLGTIADAYLPAVVYDGGYTVGYTIPTGTTTLGISKQGSANFGLGATRQLFVSGWVRVT